MNFRTIPSRTVYVRWITCFFLVFSGLQAATTVTINPNVVYQTMTGWEIVDYNPMNSSEAFPVALVSKAAQNIVFDRAVNEIGINRVRLEVPSGAENPTDTSSAACRYSTTNDNSDPNSLNMAGFNFTYLDFKIDDLVIPLRQRLQARGEQLYINLNYVSFMQQSSCSGKPYAHTNPQEYAELMLAVFTHMKQKYGFVPDAIEVILEPDNTQFWRGTQIGNAIVATAQKLQSNGFTVPKFIAPATTSMSSAPSYFDELATQVPAALQYMSEISYHRYSGVTTQALQSIASKAAQRGLGTSMLEWWSDANSYQVLHEDLKVGMNTAWQQEVIAAETTMPRGLFTVDNSNPSNPVITVAPMTRYTRHYFEFVRRGAVRVDAQSTSSSYDPLAFRNKDGKYAVVMIANGTGNISINGLPAGTYGVKYTSISDNSKYNISASDVVISGGQTLTTSIPYAAVVTVYAKTASTTIPCDINGDGSVSGADVQSAVNQALGVASCSNADLDGNSVCNVVDVQRVINNYVGGTCRVGP